MKVFDRHQVRIVFVGLIKVSTNIFLSGAYSAVLVTLIESELNTFIMLGFLARKCTTQTREGSRLLNAMTCSSSNLEKLNVSVDVRLSYVGTAMSKTRFEKAHGDFGHIINLPFYPSRCGIRA